MIKFCIQAVLNIYYREWSPIKEYKIFSPEKKVQCADISLQTVNFQVIDVIILIICYYS